MLRYPHIDPVAIQLGPVQVHWYGIMYLIGFLGAWWLGRRRARLRPDIPFDEAQVGDFIFYGALGVIIGGRVGYTLFYAFDQLLADPLSLFALWQGGMSFHGGLIGVILAMWYASYRTGRGIFEVADFVAPMIPIGLGAGRLGNFINGELWGRTTDLPWGMVFPHVGPQPRHPSQLYEFALEGAVLFAVLYWFSARPRPTMSVAGLFLALYGVFRFAVEFVRAPDPHLGAVAFGWTTMGQLLSAPMIVLGVAMLWLAYHRSGRAASDQE